MIKAAKELIDKYQSITLEQLKSLWENEVEQNPTFVDGDWVLSLITGFGSCACIVCKAASYICTECIHKYNPKWDHIEDCPCMNELYYSMSSSQSPEELYGYIQNRIEYLKYLIERSKTNL